jgi:non-homologous end joining protein Ku
MDATGLAVFDEVPDEQSPRTCSILAVHIVEPYGQAFRAREIRGPLRERAHGADQEAACEKIEKRNERAPAKVINLMDAPRKSAAADRGGCRDHLGAPPPIVSERLQIGQTRGPRH